MSPYRVLIHEDDPLYAAMVERVVVADPQLELCPEPDAASADVVVLGEGRLHEALSVPCATVALVEVASPQSASELAALGVSRVLTRSTASAVLGAELRAAAARR